MSPDQTSSPAPSPAETSRTIAVLNRDLFFGVRIANTLRAHGYTVEIAPSVERLAALLSTTNPSPALAVIDMAAVDDWSALRDLTQAPNQSTPFLALGPHKDVAAFRAAKQAGVNRVVSNGDFHREMLLLIARYAGP